MDPQVVIIVLSVLLSAFFSGLEIAFVSSNKLHIELEKKGEGFLSKILGKLTENSSKFITTMLVGNNIALVVYSYYMGELITSKLLPFLPFLAGQSFNLLLLQTVISTLIILVTAEFLPKTIFRIYANESLKLFAVPAYVFYLLFFYVSDLISGISNFLLKWLFNETQKEDQKEFSKEELGNYIDEQLDLNNQNEDLDSEIQMFQNALDFNKLKAREIMIPRTEIMAVDIHTSVKQLNKLFVESGFSKILVYRSSLDDILGYIHVFDLFKKPKTLRSVLMPVEFVPESIAIHEILNVLIKKRKSIAVVLDEYGGTSGIITVEDIIEELFGEIEDEHDSQELIENELSPGVYELSARHEINYLNETYQLNLPKEEAYETLGGFILHHYESIPSEGEKIEIEGFEIEIVKVTASRIEILQLTVKKQQN